MQRDHTQASLRLQCRLLGVCRSGLYYQPRQLDPEQLALMRRIDELSLAHPFYGSRQMSRHLRREGCPAGRDKVRRLMRKMGLEAVYCRPRTGVSLATVQRAILLGSVRKSMSLLDRPDGEPVRSLRYFASLLQEVRTESFPASYWQHLEFNLRRCERIAEVRRAEAAKSACPDLAQADPPGAVRGPSPATGEAREETG